MRKKLVAAVLCLVVLLGIPACGAEEETTAETDSGKLQVTVTFNAMAEFAHAVGGDRVAISTIIPDGSEPHDFEPTAQDLVKLSSAAVFIYNGLGMEAWAYNAVSAAQNPSLVAVDASDGAEPILNTDAEASEEHGRYDPHFWLSLKGAELEAKNIRDGFIQADPAGKDEYTQNCAAFIGQLESLYQEYQEKFETVSRKNFVTGHAAFAYLCRDFGLTQNSVEDVYAEGEPSARQLVRLIDYCIQNGVTTIFAEQTASSEVSETLAAEAGAKVKTIYTIENTEDGLSYLERMEANLQEIWESMTGGGGSAA